MGSKHYNSDRHSARRLGRKTGVEHKGHDIKDQYTLKIPTLFNTIRVGLEGNYPLSSRSSVLSQALPGYSPNKKITKKQEIQKHPKKDGKDFSPLAETPYQARVEREYPSPLSNGPHQLKGVESKMIVCKNAPPSFRNEVIDEHVMNGEESKG